MNDITVTDSRRSFDENFQVSTPSQPKTYQPLFDRVLLRRCASENELEQKYIPDAYKTRSLKGEVVAVGTGAVIGGLMVAIPLQPGDVVLFGEFGPEEIDLDGEKFILCSIHDIRLKLVV